MTQLAKLAKGDIVYIPDLTMRMHENINGCSVVDAMAPYFNSFGAVVAEYDSTVKLQHTASWSWPEVLLQKVSFSAGDTICFKKFAHDGEVYDGTPIGSLYEFAGKRFTIKELQGNRVHFSDISNMGWNIKLNMLDYSTYIPVGATSAVATVPAPVSGKVSYAVGDKLKVKSSLTIGKKYDGSSFAKAMNKSKGKIATIVNVKQSAAGLPIYNIDLDKGVYDWTPAMLEPMVVATPAYAQSAAQFVQAVATHAPATSSASSAPAAAPTPTTTSKAEQVARPVAEDEELEVGTIVRIRSGLEPARRYGNNIFSKEMEEFCGNSYVISSVNTAYGVLYALSDEKGNILTRKDSLPFQFNNSMIEGVVKEAVSTHKKPTPVSKTKNFNCAAYLAERFINYADFAECLELALVTEKNAIFYGRGGFAKTEMSRHALERNGIKPFIMSCGEGLTEEKLFGGVNMKKLKEEGVIEYMVENSFMNYEYVIFEELFDAPTSILLSLKDILTSKKFSQGKQEFEIKTKTVLALSNRTREEVGEDDSSKALLERFPLELKVEWNSYEKQDFNQLFSKVALGKTLPVEPVRPISPSKNLVRDMDMLSGICSKIHAEGEWLSPRTAMHAANVIQAAGFHFLRYVNGFADGQIDQIEKELKLQEEISKQSAEIDALKSKIQKEEQQITSAAGSHADRMLNLVRCMDKFKSEVEGFKKVKDENHKKLQELIKYTESQKQTYLAKALAGA